MNRTEFEDLESYFKVLQNKMAERDEDCAELKNAVDKGYSLAVGHMNSEIETILHELEMQIFPASDNRVGDMDIEKAISILCHMKNLITVRTFEEEALAMAIQALEMQIAKKMNVGNDNGKLRKCCGHCGCFVLPTSNYCSKCGWKIDWD